ARVSTPSPKCSCLHSGGDADQRHGQGSAGGAMACVLIQMCCEDAAGSRNCGLAEITFVWRYAIGTRRNDDRTGTGEVGHVRWIDGIAFTGPGGRGGTGSAAVFPD